MDLYDVSEERKVVLMCEPYLLGFSHILRHLHATEAMEAEGPFVAATDGRSVWYGNEYTELSPPERRYVHVHELMHGILHHPDRAMLLRLSRGTVNLGLHNRACDALVNEGIESNPTMPSGLFKRPEKWPPILMKTIHEDMADAIAFSGAEPPSSYDAKARHGLQSETVYDWLIWALDAVKKKRRQDCGKAQKDAGTKAETSGSSTKGKAEPDSVQCTCGQCPGAIGKPHGAPTRIERAALQDAWDLQERLEELDQLLDKGVTASELISQVNSRLQDARMRVQQAVQGLKLAGRGQGGLLLKLAEDLPKPVVPWNQVLRRVATRGLGTKLNDSYTRFGPSTMFAIARRERVVPYSPGTTIFTERPRVLVILDVSGSHLSQIKLCFSEIWSIAKMKSAVVDVMTFDDGVREILEIKDKRDFDKILRRGVQAGGGTWLKDVWAQVAQMRDPYRMAVVMTDGYLDAGKAPKIPVVWMVTPGGSTKFATYGEVINLPELMDRTRKSA